VVIDPADIPEDAAGRIEVIAIRAPADVIDPGEAEAPAESAQPSRVAAMLMAYDGWVTVAAVVAIVAVLFVIGMVATH